MTIRMSACQCLAFRFSLGLAEQSANCLLFCARLQQDAEEQTWSGGKTWRYVVLDSAGADSRKSKATSSPARPQISCRDIQEPFFISLLGLPACNGGCAVNGAFCS
jgi:hypothetical protein